MTNWLYRLLARLGTPATPLAAASAGATAAAVAVPVRARAAEWLPDLRTPFFEWLLASGPSLDTPLQQSEQKLLAHLDSVLACETARSALLPRSPALIPQLLGCLRDEARSSTALAQHVAKDPHLIAEVIRMANSVQARGRESTADLSQAIERVGIDGLRRAIARVVLKPLFDARNDPLSARAAARLWLHSEAQAAACMRAAAHGGHDPFEGYLAGLMHNIGWTCALRGIDRSESAAPAAFSTDFIVALDARREALFARLVMPWQLNDSLTALGAELLDAPLSQARSALGVALREAEQRATAELLALPIAAEEAELDLAV